MALPWETVEEASLPGGGGWDVVSAEEPPDVETGAGFMDRVLASFKSNPESAANFYRTRYGQDNVRVEGGEVQFKAPKTGRWTQADPKRLDWGDLADLVGELPELIGAGVGGVMGATAGLPTGPGAVATALGGAAVGGAGGNIVKQTIGALVPGGDVETPLQRAGGVVQSGAWAGIGEGAGLLVQKGIIKPTMQWLFRRGSGTATATEARAIEAAINQGRAAVSPEFRFTPGQETGSRALAGVEDLISSSLSSMDAAAARRAGQLDALQDKALRMVDDLRGGRTPISDLTVGGELQTMFKRVDDLMVESLEDRATRGFKVLGQMKADRPMFDVPKLRNALAELQYADTSSTGAKGAIAKGVAQILDELPERLTLNDVQLYMKRFGRVGYMKGEKTFLELLGDADRAKMARKLFATLSEDLDDAAARTVAGGRTAPGARMASDLRDAKNEYAAGLDELRGWQDGLFAKVVGDYGPESAGRIVANLNRLNPDELKSVMTVIGMRPDVADAVKANWLEGAITAATEKSAQRGAGEFNPKLMMDELGFGRRGGLGRAEAILGRTQPQVMRDLLMIQEASRRINASAFGGVSPTFGRTEAWKTLKMMSTPVQLAELSKNLLLPRYLAKILLNPQAREELNIIASAKAPTRRVVAAITYLIGDQALEEARQQ